MKLNLRLVFGILLVAIGGLIVLQNLNVFAGNLGNIVWAVLFTAIGVYLFVLYGNRRENYWWLILGLIALSFTAGNLAVLIPSLAPYSSLFPLFGAGVGFLAIYIIERRQWWVFIPAGIFISLGVDELMQITTPNSGSDGVIFFGLGLAFMALYFLPAKEGKMNWAILPTVIFLVLGILASFEQGNQALQITGPVLLLIAGAAVLFYSLRKK